MNREPGYYAVKYHDTWQVGRFDQGRWYLTFDVLDGDGDFSEINETRILMPGEMSRDDITEQVLNHSRNLLYPRIEVIPYRTDRPLIQTEITNHEHPHSAIRKLIKLHIHGSLVTPTTKIMRDAWDNMILQATGKIREEPLNSLEVNLFKKPILSFKDIADFIGKRYLTCAPEDVSIIEAIQKASDKKGGTMPYKDLLKKYINHVGQCEGVNFIDRLNNRIDSDIIFTELEVSALQELSKEVSAENNS